jgi:hypothetical protein
MTLLPLVTRRLRERQTPFAVIGAAAMAARGVSRSTGDLDLLTLERACLDPAYWAELAVPTVALDLRVGDADDPLAGVVRFTAGDEFPLDLIVGKSGWQARVLGRATASEIAGTSVPIADRAGLILLKLFAGGPQDAWDVAQLLAAGDRAATAAEVDREIGALPPECRSLWEHVRG